MNKPSILVPLSQATRGEQIQNANYFLQKGCCLVANEEQLTPQLLMNKIEEAFAKDSQLKLNMKKQKIDGTQKIVKEILNAISN